VFERFTDRARRVVVLAQEEARYLNHNYIGTEHILLGLLNEGEGIAAHALEQLDIDLASVREEVVKIIGQGQQSPPGHMSLAGTFANQMPEKSGFPSGVRGAGALKSGLPSAVRGMPGVG